MWRTDSIVIESKGATSVGKRSGQDRKDFHKGQFFTPDAAAKLMWSIASLGMTEQRSYSVADFGVGSGQLIQYCKPDQHTLLLADVDTDAVRALRKDLSAAGFDFQITPDGMESVSAQGVNVGLLNPAFNLLIDDARLDASFDCVKVNRALGINTTVSHRYAVEQALATCEVVVALLPYPEVIELQKGRWRPLGADRLSAVVKLPQDLFAEQKTLISTGLAIFARTPTNRVPDHFEYAHFKPAYLTGDFSLVSDAPEFEVAAVPRLPKATLPVTGDRRVELTRKGRRIVPVFHCGEVEENVLGAILRAPVSEYQISRRDLRYHYAKTNRYIGDAMLDIEAWLKGPGVADARDQLYAVIRDAGGVPSMSEQLETYLAKRQRQHDVASTPFAHWVYSPTPVATVPTTATTKKIFALDPSSIVTPTLRAGAEVAVEACTGGYKVTFPDGQVHTIPSERFAESFKLPDAESGDSAGEWVQQYPGRLQAFPDKAQSIRGEAIKRGVDTLLSWDYQLDDLVEVMMSKGAVVAWEMALGKGRLALALAMMGGPRNLICVEPYLVDELCIEIGNTSLADDEWQVIESPEQARNLRRINIITYNRLRAPLQRPAQCTAKPVADAGAKHATRRLRTYADVMAKRISVAVADEGSLLANEDSAQSRAIAKLHPKRRYVLDGTPNQNYPRDALPVITWVAGDSTALQQYGRWHYSLEAHAFKSTAYLEQGRTAFSKQFTTLVIGSHEDGTEFRNEIPIIQDVMGYRRWLAPLVKRRVQAEPEVTRHLKIEPPIARKVILKWDREHLDHYVRVSTEFARHYEAQLRAREEEGKNLNFAVVLARIGACVRAANLPQKASSDFAAITLSATSKQRYACARAIELAKGGEKVIVYVDGPDHAERLARLIRQKGQRVALVHGKISINKRTRDLNDNFRYGDTMILVASAKCCGKGLNIPQASRVIMAVRNWSYSRERQAIFRTCRAQQKRQVYVEFLELEGSVDAYQDQVVAFKRECQQVGLDWATPTLTADQYLHMDTLFDRFCRSLKELSAAVSISHNLSDNVLRFEPEYVY